MTNSSDITPALAQVSCMFALELRELTRAIERGEDIAQRLRVIREYCHTWDALAEQFERMVVLKERQ